jgi:26S proteasome regulatory subunit T6
MVREIFSMARQHAPCIIFMDEVDSIGSKRSSTGRGDSEVQRTMLELLSQVKMILKYFFLKMLINKKNKLDGFEESKNIKIIMATNRIDILDPALLRPGRIDRKVEFPNPSVEVKY